jgi:hypothetical protein
VSFESGFDFLPCCFAVSDFFDFPPPVDLEPLGLLFMGLAGSFEIFFCGISVSGGTASLWLNVSGGCGKVSSDAALFFFFDFFLAGFLGVFCSSVSSASKVFLN